jgi:hypothetical protein
MPDARRANGGRPLVGPSSRAERNKAARGRDLLSIQPSNAEPAMRLVLIILLVLLLIGSVPVWPYSAHWGYYPTGGLGLVLVIVLIVALVG